MSKTFLTTPFSITRLFFVRLGVPIVPDLFRDCGGIFVENFVRRTSDQFRHSCNHSAEDLIGLHGIDVFLNQVLTHGFAFEPGNQSFKGIDLVDPGSNFQIRFVDSATLLSFGQGSVR
jgi:hypothetical protein